MTVKLEHLRPGGKFKFNNDKKTYTCTTKDAVIEGEHDGKIKLYYSYKNTFKAEWILSRSTRVTLWIK